MAKIYLEQMDTQFRVSNSGSTVYGAQGDQSISIDAGVSGVTFDQNVESIMFNGDSSNFKFQQSAAIMKVYAADGTTLIAEIPVANGMDFTFDNGTVEAKLTGRVMTLGDAEIDTTVATASPSTLSLGSNIAITGDGQSDASADNYTYDIAAGSYSHIIAGFDSGDILDFPDNISPSVTNSDWGDGSVDLTYAYSGQVATITLTGLGTNDGSLNAIGDFDTIFGAGSIA